MFKISAIRLINFNVFAVPKITGTRVLVTGYENISESGMYKSRPKKPKKKPYASKWSRDAAPYENVYNPKKTDVSQQTLVLPVYKNHEG
jgi:hypothetical protein